MKICDFCYIYNTAVILALQLPTSLEMFKESASDPTFWWITNFGYFGFTFMLWRNACLLFKIFVIITLKQNKILKRELWDCLSIKH